MHVLKRKHFNGKKRKHKVLYYLRPNMQIAGHSFEILSMTFLLSFSFQCNADVLLENIETLKILEMARWWSKSSLMRYNDRYIVSDNCMQTSMWYWGGRGYWPVSSNIIPFYCFILFHLLHISINMIRNKHYINAMLDAIKDRTAFAGERMNSINCHNSSCLIVFIIVTLSDLMTVTDQDLKESSLL